MGNAEKYYLGMTEGGGIGKLLAKAGALGYNSAFDANDLLSKTGGKKRLYDNIKSAYSGAQPLIDQIKLVRTIERAYKYLNREAEQAEKEATKAAKTMSRLQKAQEKAHAKAVANETKSRIKAAKDTAKVDGPVGRISTPVQFRARPYPIVPSAIYSSGEAGNIAALGRIIANAPTKYDAMYAGGAGRWDSFVPPTGGNQNYVGRAYKAPKYPVLTSTQAVAARIIDARAKSKEIRQSASDWLGSRPSIDSGIYTSMPNHYEIDAKGNMKLISGVEKAVEKGTEKGQEKAQKKVARGVGGFEGLLRGAKGTQYGMWQSKIATRGAALGGKFGKAGVVGAIIGTVWDALKLVVKTTDKYAAQHTKMMLSSAYSGEGTGRAWQLYLQGEAMGKGLGESKLQSHIATQATLGGVMRGDRAGILEKLAQKWGISYLGSGPGGLATDEEIKQRIAETYDRQSSSIEKASLLADAGVLVSADEAGAMKFGPKFFAMAQENFKKSRVVNEAAEKDKAVREYNITKAQVAELGWTMAGDIASPTMKAIEGAKDIGNSIRAAFMKGGVSAPWGSPMAPIGIANPWIDAAKSLETQKADPTSEYNNSTNNNSNVNVSFHDTKITAEGDDAGAILANATVESIEEKARPLLKDFLRQEVA